MGCDCFRDHKPQLPSNSLKHRPPEKPPIKPTQSGDYEAAADQAVPRKKLSWLEKSRVARKSASDIRENQLKQRDFREVSEGIESCYRLGKESLGNLVLAEHVDTKRKLWTQTYAVGQGQRNKEIKQQLLMIKTLDHPKVLKVVDLLQDDSHLLAVYEGTEGKSAGQLYEAMSEQEVIAIMRQVFNALSYCHSLGLVLKCLSLQHIIFLHPPTEGNIAVKLRVPLDEELSMNSAYVAPELRNKTYIGSENDLWSCGMLLSYLLTGNCVLVKQNPATLTEEFKSSYKKWEKVSKPVKSLILSLVSQNYHKRPTIAQCLQHPWMSVPLPTPALTPTLRKALRHMAQARPLPSLKRAFLQLMFNFVLSAEDLSEAREAFTELDIDLDGKVSEAELQTPLYQLFPGDQAQAALTALTASAVFTEDRKLTYSEFLLWACDYRIFTSKAHLAATYRLLDRDKDGLVGTRELREMLSLEPGDNKDIYTWQCIISLVSTTEAGFNYQDFLRFMHKQ